MKTQINLERKYNRMFHQLKTYVDQEMEMKILIEIDKNGLPFHSMMIEDSTAPTKNKTSLFKIKKMTFVMI